MPRSLLVLGLVPVLVASCRFGDPYPPLDAARQLAADNHPAPLVLVEETISWSTLPELIFMGERSVEQESPFERPRRSVKYLVREARADGAAVVSVSPWLALEGYVHTPALIGPGGTLSGGLSYPASLTRIAELYALAPVDLGFRTSGTGSVLRLTSDSAEASGLALGDTVLEIDGVPYDPKHRAPDFVEIVSRLRPGDSFQVTWSGAPGEAQSAELVAAPNEPRRPNSVE